MPEHANADVLIVVPARYGSRRLPGKPLVEIAGVSLLARTVDVARVTARLAGGADIVVATDDARVADHARALGCEVAMTATEIDSGSSRALAAARQRQPVPAIVVNLQGDAPFIPPTVVAALMGVMRAGNDGVATPVVRLGWDALDRLRSHKAVTPSSGTTCVAAPDGRALWFSKTIIPSIRDEAARRAAEPLSPVLRHLGLYAYRLAALERFAAAPPSYYEQVEGLEQLRFIQLGLTIRTVAVEPPVHDMSGIDTAADVALAESLIAMHGDPYPG